MVVDLGRGRGYVMDRSSSRSQHHGIDLGPLRDEKHSRHRIITFIKHQPPPTSSDSLREFSALLFWGDVVSCPPHGSEKYTGVTSESGCESHDGILDKPQLSWHD